jgi:hypothetical protein
MGQSIRPIVHARPSVRQDRIHVSLNLSYPTLFFQFTDSFFLVCTMRSAMAQTRSGSLPGQAVVHSLTQK